LRSASASPPGLQFGTSVSGRELKEWQERAETVSVFFSARKALCRTVFTRGVLTLLAAAAGSGGFVALVGACPLLQGLVVGGSTALFVAALYGFRAVTAPPPLVIQLEKSNHVAVQMHKAKTSAPAALSEPAEKIVGQARAIAAGVLPEEQEVVRLFLAYRAGFAAKRVGAIDYSQLTKTRGVFVSKPRSDEFLLEVARDFFPTLETISTKKLALEVYNTLLADAGGPAAELVAEPESETELLEASPPSFAPPSPYWAVSAAAALGALAGVGAAWPACAPPTLAAALGAAGGAVFGVAAVCGAAAVAAALARRAHERWVARARLESAIEAIEDMYGYEPGVFGESGFIAMMAEDPVDMDTLFDSCERGVAEYLGQEG